MPEEEILENPVESASESTETVEEVTEDKPTEETQVEETQVDETQVEETQVEETPDEEPVSPKSGSESDIGSLEDIPLEDSPKDPSAPLNPSASLNPEPTEPDVPLENEEKMELNLSDYPSSSLETNHYTELCSLVENFMSCSHLIDFCVRAIHLDLKNKSTIQFTGSYYTYEITDMGNHERRIVLSTNRDCVLKLKVNREFVDTALLEGSDEQENFREILAYLLYPLKMSDSVFQDFMDLLSRETINNRIPMDGSLCKKNRRWNLRASPTLIDHNTYRVVEGIECNKSRCERLRIARTFNDNSKFWNVFKSIF